MKVFTKTERVRERKTCSACRVPLSGTLRLEKIINRKQKHEAK